MHEHAHEVRPPCRHPVITVYDDDTAGAVVVYGDDDDDTMHASMRIPLSPCVD